MSVIPCNRSHDFSAVLLITVWVSNNSILLLNKRLIIICAVLIFSQQLTYRPRVKHGYVEMCVVCAMLTDPNKWMDGWIIGSEHLLKKFHWVT